MGKIEELCQLLETSAKICKQSIPRAEITADKELLDRASSKIMRVVFHLEHNLAIPNISIFGPGISIVQESLEQGGFESDFKDYVVFKDATFFGDIYPLANGLLYAILSRVQLREGDDEFASQALFSEKFNPEHLRL